MDIYKLKFTILQMEIFRLFCIKTGLKLNQRQIAKLLKVSPTAIAKSIPFLEKEQLIKVAKGATKLVELNRDSKKTLELKRVENFKLLVETGLIEFLEDFFPGTAIVLFGSYGRGDDISKSDIDIAIIGSKGKKISLAEFEKKLEKEIRINFFEDFREINSNLKSSICNGIVLSGGLEL